MELTHAYTYKNSVLDQKVSGQTTLSAFISKHAEVFRSLTRAGTPYGGNWLPERSRFIKTTPAGKVTSAQLADLQYQISTLSQTVARLVEQLNAQQESTQLVNNSSAGAEQSTEIGIHRFRSIQTEV